ncbi:MAG: hypothetical protein Q8R47_00595 [Nanoarchaeota archaeon]|nr:hypothetical protein [Nanoarchaeota archaeon]
MTEYDKNQAQDIFETNALAGVPDELTTLGVARKYQKCTQRDLVPAISAPQALDWLVQQNVIPAAEVETNRTMLAKAQEADKRQRDYDVKSALVEYGKQYSSLTRFLRFVSRGFKRYRPNLISPTASPETQLLEQVIALQDAVVKGSELFKALPDVVQKMKTDYGKLSARQEGLETRIAGVKGDLHSLPERQREYTELLRGLEKYDILSEPEKKTISAELHAKTGVDILPPLENAAVRSQVRQKMKDGKKILSDDNLSSLLEVLNIEYASVQRQQRMIESQECQLEQGWKPALIQLSRVKEQYDLLSRFTSGARLLIGMNELRKNTAEMIAQSEEVMVNAASYVDNTRIEAEAYEDSFSRPAEMRIFPEADTDEAIVIDVEEEPEEFSRVERK